MDTVTKCGVYRKVEFPGQLRDHQLPKKNSKFLDLRLFVHVKCTALSDFDHKHSATSDLSEVPQNQNTRGKITSKFLDLRPTTPKHEMFYHFKSHLSM